MARKGDIDSKSVASRVPMEVYLRLLKNSSSNKQTLSSYLCDVLSDEKFSQGGETKIEYQDKWHIDPKLVRENEQLKTRIKEQVVSIENLESKLKESIKEWATIVKDQNREIDKLKGK